MRPTGLKSVAGLYFTALEVSGSITIMCVFATSTVAPSAGAWRTKSAAIWPPAPGRFSTITVLPRSSRSLSASMRASASEEPPAG